MENLPLLYTNAQLYDRQDSIRQDMERARLSSAAFSCKMSQLINAIEFLFKDATVRLSKGNKTNNDTRVSHQLAKDEWKNKVPQHHNEQPVSAP